MEKEVGCCGIKVFVGVSTGTLIVSDYKDIKRIMKSTKNRTVHIWLKKENLKNLKMEELEQ